MIQYNISLFFEPSITDSALRALKTVLMPEIEKQNFVSQIYLFEITSHQEPDSKGFSLQCWLPEMNCIRIFPKRICESVCLFSKSAEESVDYRVEIIE